MWNFPWNFPWFPSLRCGFFHVFCRKKIYNPWLSSKTLRKLSDVSEAPEVQSWRSMGCATCRLKKRRGTAEQVLETLRKSPKSQECFRKWSMNIYDIYVHGGFVILSLLVYWRAQGLKFAVHCRSFKSWQQWPGAPKGQKITKWAAVPIANVTNSHFEWKQSATATWGDDWEFP